MEGMTLKSKSGLSPAVVKLAKEGTLVAGVYRDGRGLLLKVEEGGSGRRVLRISVKGKRRDLGLGSVRDVGLAEAREKAGEKRKEIRSGKTNPRPKALSFKEAAEAVYELRKGGWRGDGRHIDQWWTSLETHVFPRVGKTMVGRRDARRHAGRAHTDLARHPRDRTPREAAVQPCFRLGRRQEPPLATASESG